MEQHESTIPLTFPPDSDLGIVEQFVIDRRYIPSGQGIAYGDNVEIYRDEIDNGLRMLHPKTGNVFYAFGSHLREKELFEFVKVVIA